jgi:hypothetical protein
MLVCIIELPLADYKALMLLALKPVADLSPCMDSTSVELAAQLQTGIRAADVIQYENDTLGYAIFRNFTGWGISGWIVNFTTDAPLPPAYMRQCLDILTAANTTSHALTTAQQAGIIAGSVVGGIGVLAAIAITFVVVWNRRKR